MKNWERMTPAEKREAKKKYLAKAEHFLLTHGHGTKSFVSRMPQAEKLFIYEMERHLRKKS